MIKKVIPFPSVLKPILEEVEEEDDEGEEDNLLLNQRTRRERATRSKRRRRSTITPPSILEKPIQSTTSEDEMKQWIYEQDVEGTYVLKIPYFDLMSVGTELVVDKIRNTPTNQPQ